MITLGTSGQEDRMHAMRCRKKSKRCAVVPQVACSELPCQPVRNSEAPLAR